MIVGKIVRFTAVLPPLIISLLTYLSTDFSNYYMLLGAVSLILITSTDRLKWAGVALIYLPAAYTVYLLFSGNPAPFLGLATGYVLASPIVFALAAYNSKNLSGLFTGYFTAYVFATLLYSVAEGGNTKPETIFTTLVRNLIGVFSRDVVNVIPPQTPPIFLMSSITGVATIALMLYTAAKPDGLPHITLEWMGAFLTAIALMGIGLLTVTFYPWLTPAMILGIVSLLTLAAAVMLRWLYA